MEDDFSIVDNDDFGIVQLYDVISALATTELFDVSVVLNDNLSDTELQIAGNQEMIDIISDIVKRCYK